MRPVRLTKKQLGKKLQMQLLPGIESNRPKLHAHQKDWAERDIQKTIIEYLERNPKIAWVKRMNSGLFKKKNKDGSYRWIRAGFEGCPDVMAMMGFSHGGKFVAIECKSYTGPSTDEQIKFLQSVRAGGGVGIIARSVDDVIAAIDKEVKNND